MFKHFKSAGLLAFFMKSLLIANSSLQNCFEARDVNKTFKLRSWIGDPRIKYTTFIRQNTYPTLFRSIFFFAVICGYVLHTYVKKSLNKAVLKIVICYVVQCNFFFPFLPRIPRSPFMTLSRGKCWPICNLFDILYPLPYVYHSMFFLTAAVVIATTW